MFNKYTEEKLNIEILSHKEVFKKIKICCFSTNEHK